MGYLANFMVYTLAMIGIIAIALLVFKNSLSFGGGAKSKYIKVHDSISLAPRKTLYIVSAGQEKFLIAGDVNQTTLISKLGSTSNEVSVTPQVVETSFKETMTKLSKPSYMDTSNIGIKSSLLSNRNETKYNSVMKNLASRMQE